MALTNVKHKKAHKELSNEPAYQSLISACMNVHKRQLREGATEHRLQ